MKRALTVYFLVFGLQAIGQSGLDSLWAVYHDLAREEAERYNALNDIAWEYLYSDPDSMRLIGTLLAEETERTGNVYWQAKANNGIAVSYYLQGEFKEALDHFELCMGLYGQINDREGIAAAASNMGNVFNDAGDYPKAMQYYLRALKIEEELGITEDAAGSYGNIAILHYEMGNYEEALLYHDKCIAAFTEVGDVFSLARAYNNRGTVLERTGDFDGAIKSYETSLALRDSLGDEESKSSSYHNLAVVYAKIGEKELAIELFNKCLAIEEGRGDQYGITNSWNSLGQLYNEYEEYGTAVEWCLKGLDLAREIETTSLERSACECLYTAYKGLNKTDEALAYHERFILLRDSINNEEKDRDMMQQGFQFTYEMRIMQDSIIHEEEQKRKDEKQAMVLEQEEMKRYGLYAGIGVVSLFLVFVLNRYRASNRQKRIIQSQKEQVDLAYDSLEEKNREIMDSITYARHLQEAILPPARLVKQWLTDSFILYKPKDIVAGDFYWMETSGDLILFAAADCTGHGVPGAMVSVICSNGLNKAVNELNITDPGKILDKTRELVIERFNKSEKEVHDGMDISLVALHLDKRQLWWAGANNPLWIIRQGELIELKPDTQPVGNMFGLAPFTTHEVKLEEGDALYLFSDGYPDQFGGDKGKKFKSGAFKKLLLSIQGKDMEEQKSIIDAEFEQWRGDLEQVDDVCVIGVRL